MQNKSVNFYNNDIYGSMSISVCKVKYVFWNKFSMFSKSNKEVYDFY